jgi:hypothetical protein
LGNRRECADDNRSHEGREEKPSSDELLKCNTNGASIGGREGGTVRALVSWCGNSCPEVMTEANASDDVEGSSRGVRNDVDGASAARCEDLIGDPTLEFLRRLKEVRHHGLDCLLTVT